MTAVGYEVSEVPRKPAQLGPHTESAAWVQAVVKHTGLSLEKAAAKAELSTGGLKKLYYGWQKPRWDTIEKLRAIAPPELRQFRDSDARLGETVSGSSNLARDPNHHVHEEGGDNGGYEVKTPEGTIIAKMLDAIPDDGERTEKMLAAAEAIRNPQIVSAEKRSDRAHRKHQ